MKWGVISMLGSGDESASGLFDGAPIAELVLMAAGLVFTIGLALFFVFTIRRKSAEHDESSQGDSNH